MSDVDITTNVSDAHVPGPEPAPAATPPAESAPATETPQVEGDPADTPQPPEKGKPDAGFQKAINRLTRQRGDAERRAMRLEAELEAYRKIGAPQQPQPKSASERKPSDYANYDDYVRDQAAEAARVAAQEAVTASQRAQAQREAQQSATQARQAFEKEATRQAATAGIDFDDAWETLLDLPPSSVSEVVADYFFNASENKAALVDHFAKNTDEIARISSLPPVVAVRELAKLDARLGTPARPNATSAPPPGPTLGGGRGVAPRDPEKMSMEEFAAWRSAQKKAQRG